MINKEEINKTKEYTYICPICRKKHQEEIFINASWHCELCGTFHYSPEYGQEIQDLLSDAKCRQVLIAFIREQWQKTHQPADINPHIIRQVLKDKGVL